jgi:hypothetical protein
MKDKPHSKYLRADVKGASDFGSPANGSLILMNIDKRKSRPPVEGAVSRLKPKKLRRRNQFGGGKNIRCRLIFKAFEASFGRFAIGK